MIRWSSRIDLETNPHHHNDERISHRPTHAGWKQLRFLEAYRGNTLREQRDSEARARACLLNAETGASAQGNLYDLDGGNAHSFRNRMSHQGGLAQTRASTRSEWEVHGDDQERGSFTLGDYVRLRTLCSVRARKLFLRDSQI